MQNNKWRLRHCVRILSIVILLSFLKSPMYADPPMAPPPNSTANETRLYSDSEVETLIDEISEAAHEAIDKAAAEAAKAATLEAVQREAALARQSQFWRNEAELHQQAVTEAKKAGRKNTLIGVLIGIFSGLAVGVAGTIIIGGK